MRIKKPNIKVNEDITFDTIADRNNAIKDLFDGDLVKVLDASNDPQITSGWAVYRFCFETQTFDLVEQEIKKTIKLDQITMVKNNKGELASFFGMNLGGRLSIPRSTYLKTKITQQELRFEWVSKSYMLQFEYDNLTHFDSDETYLRCYKKDLILNKAALKKLYADYGEVVYAIYWAGIFRNGNITHAHWQYVTELPSDTYYHLNRGYCMFAAVRIHLHPVYYDVYATSRKTLVNHLYREGYSEPLGGVDDDTTALDVNKNIIAFHNLNHGAGFEFPNSIDLGLSDFKAGKDGYFVFSGVRRNKEHYTYDGVKYKLGLQNMPYTQAAIKANCDTMGLTHYVKISTLHDETALYEDCIFEASKEMPTINKHYEYPKYYMPIAVVKMVFNPDYTLNLAETKISKIFKNGELTDKLARYKSFDNYKVMQSVRNSCQDGEIVKCWSAANDARINKNLWVIYQWNKSKDRFEILSIQPELDLKGMSFPTITERDAGKETLYNGQLIKVVDASKDTEINKGWATYRYIASSKKFDLISCEFPKINLENVEIPTQELDLKAKSFPSINERNIEKETLYNGQLIKVLDASEDNQISKGWATYRYIGIDQTFELISCEFPKIDLTGVVMPVVPVSSLPNHTYNLVYQMVADKANLKDGEIIMVLDARGHDDIMSEMWATFRFNKASSSFTVMSTEFPIFPSIPQPDKETLDFIGGGETVTCLEARHGFRADMRILRDFDYSITLESKKINFTRVHGASGDHVPIRCADGLKWLDVNNFWIDLDTVDQGKTIYYNIGTSFLPSSDRLKGMGKSVVKSSKGTLTNSKTYRDSSCTTYSLRIEIPASIYDLELKHITVHKLWKKSMGTTYELIQYMDVNP